MIFIFCCLVINCVSQVSCACSGLKAELVSCACSGLKAELVVWPWPPSSDVVYPLHEFKDSHFCCWDCAWTREGNSYLAFYNQVSGKVKREKSKRKTNIVNSNGLDPSDTCVFLFSLILI